MFVIDAKLYSTQPLVMTTIHRTKVHTQLIGMKQSTSKEH